MVVFGFFGVGVCTDGDYGYDDYCDRSVDVFYGYACR